MRFGRPAFDTEVRDHGHRQYVPLSRRPREYLAFDDDGTVRRSATGPDDRAREVDRAAWREEGGRVRFRLGTTDYEIVEQAGDRLVIRRG